MSRLDTFLSHSGREYTRMRLGLYRMRELLARLGHPESVFGSVLIAGTNGKGSVARMTEAALRQAGFRVGLYTSPHLARFHERILVGGAELEDEALETILADFAAQGLLAEDGGVTTSSGEPLTWFEKTTLLAFEAFRRAGVSLAVLEVGLGGRMDATNVVMPLASAITSIGLDHTEVLGPTLRDIAREKAGVMRSGHPVVLGEMDPEIRKYLSTEAENLGARPRFTEAVTGDRNRFAYRGYSNLALSLLGDHQLRNVATAVELLGCLSSGGFAVNNAQLRVALQSLRHPGRLEWFAGEPPVLVDGAHNPEALTALVEYLYSEHPKCPVSLVLGMMREKDRAQALRLLRGLEPHFFITEVANPRSVSLEEWRKLCAVEGVAAEFFSEPDRALEQARRRCPKGGMVLVTGSLYLVAALRSRLSA